MVSRQHACLYATILLTASAQADSIDNAGVIDEVVVTGTRASDHTEGNSSTPISVYDSAQLQRSGFSDLGRALSSLAPSINLPHSQTSPSAANTRPVTMKGMSPDQVLVLINGKRWETSSVLNFNNAVGRGSAPYDLSAIPLNAIERVEVLDDGAAAQYGSDAIAGVVNIILKSAASGSLFGAQGSITDKGDGTAYDLTGSQGLSLGGNGHLTLSADLLHQDTTNRAPVDPRTGRVDQQAGDPRDLNIGFVADAGHPLIADWNAYASLLASRRDSQSAPTFRLPGSSVLYPHGFLPQVNPVIWDTTLIGGLKGSLGSGFNADLSNSYGLNHARFDVRNTANDALGATSPTQFYSGSLNYSEDTVNLTIDRDLADLLLPGHLATGVEYRFESYSITNGEPLSYEQGGAQGFPGFAPRIPVDNSRHAESVFVDLEANPLHWIRLGASGRYDHYSDFGHALTWKGTARADVTDWLAFRGALGTGFRAPSLQQNYFSSVVSQINTAGALIRTGTYQVNDPIARALGATPLQAEKSRDYSVGVTSHPLPALLVTADWYDVDVHDRIVLSNQLSGPAVNAILAANGVTNVQQVQFFTNGAHTRTQGWELMGSYSASFNEVDSLSASIQYGQYHTKLLELAANRVIPALPLLSGTAEYLLVSAQPSDKLTSSLSFTHKPLSLTLNTDHYGSWYSAPLGTAQYFSGKTLLDITAKIAVSQHLSASAGVLNVGNVYPDLTKGANAIGLAYGDEAPFGVNGRSYFLRLDLVVE